MVRSLKLPGNMVALLSLIVCELLDNAVEALRAKGKVMIDVDVLSSKRSLYIRVQDNGPGVTKGDESRVFDEHYSTRGSGRGLGLYLVKEALLKLGGKVEYSFKKGSIFCATLPVS